MCLFYRIANMCSKVFLFFSSIKVKIAISYYISIFYVQSDSVESNWMQILKIIKNTEYKKNGGNPRNGNLKNTFDNFINIDDMKFKIN